MCNRRLLLVLATWSCMFIGIIATSVLLIYIKGATLALERIVEMYNDEPYLAVYAEIIGVGGLPLFISILCRDDFATYGFRRRGMLASLGLSSTLTVISLLRTLQGGWSFESFNLESPLNIWYAVLGVLAYGPLEVFFVIWLIVNTDKIFDKYRERSRRELSPFLGILSPGLLITVAVFSLSHLIFSPAGGVPNAMSVGAVFLALGLIFNYTKNAVGPVIAWTLINGQVLYLLAGSLT